jgi:hypothetical protein
MPTSCHLPFLGEAVSLNLKASPEDSVSSIPCSTFEVRNIDSSLILLFGL